MTSLMKAPGGVAANHDVKSKMLELIQSWATAAEGRSNLGYINDVALAGGSFPLKADAGRDRLSAEGIRQVVDAFGFDLTPVYARRVNRALTRRRGKSRGRSATIS